MSKDKAMRMVRRILDGIDTVDAIDISITLYYDYMRSEGLAK